MLTSPNLQDAREAPPTSLDRACAVGQAPAEQTELRVSAAAPDFSLRARRHVVAVLAGQGDVSGEDLTNSCKAAGIVPHDDRAFGAVYAWLVRTGQIRCVGMVARKKGHGTSGGRVWRLLR